LELEEAQAEEKEEKEE
jgi:hypothetical protein